jgi:hypothetical protein
MRRSLRHAAAAGLVVAGALPLLAGVGVGVAGAGTPAVSGLPLDATGTLTASPTSVNFGNITLGDESPTTAVTLTNNGASPITITGVTLSGNSNDFDESDNCSTLAVGGSCVMQLDFTPGAVGPRTATVTPVTGTTAAPGVTLAGTGTEGYYEVTAQGAVATHGDATQLGSAAGLPLARPIVAIAATGSDAGYWLAASDGGVFTYGDAAYYGSTGAIRLNRPIVDIVATPDGAGYWLVASDGGVFTYGDATYHGSTGSIHLNAPIVGMAATPDGAGYWLVASDGGVFTFGDATYHGSTGSIHLNKPIVGMAATPDGRGYWLVAADGGIFAFGDAAYYGSTGAIHLNAPIVGMAATPDGAGYWLMASDGGIFTFGDAPFDQSSATAGAANFVSLVGDAPPTLQAVLDQPAARGRARARSDAG